MITKSIIGYEDRYTIDINGFVFDKKKCVNIKCHDKKGYKRLALSKNKKQKLFYLHRLIAIHFIENKENKPHINHIDGNPSNNKIHNLEWVTHKENMQHAYRTGLTNYPNGELSRRAKLTNEDVMNIVNDSEFIKRKDLMLKYKVSKATIQNILTGRSWRHITGIEIK